MEQAQETYQTVAEFIEAVGRSTFETDLGHSSQVVSRAIVGNVMPAHWYMDIKDACSAWGVACPDHLFKWSRSSPKKSADTSTVPVVQEAAK